MEYTVQKLGSMAGVSTRTLRYYDEIGILKPARKNSSGYRIYGQREVEKLQQILFYRELSLDLESIKRIVDDPLFDNYGALKQHRQELMKKRQQLDLLINNVEKTISAAEGKRQMTDKEKFEGFKRQLIEDNEMKYGEEVRRKYGDVEIDKSNAGMLNLSEEQYREFIRLGQEVLDTLAAACKRGDPSSETAQKAAELHKQWLSFTWPVYSKEAHAGLAQMYVDDERFALYYNKVHPDAAGFLRDAIHIYTGFQK